MFTYKDTRIACYIGYVVQAIVNNLIPIFFVIFHDDFGIPFEMLGRIILINFVTQLIVDVVIVKYAEKIGQRVCIVAACLFSFVGLLMLGILPTVMASKYTGILISVMVYAVGGGIIEVLISPIADALPGDKKTASMSLLHSFYSWGQVTVILTTTIVLSIIDYGRWHYIPIFWSLIPLFNMFLFTKVPLVPLAPAHEKTSVKKLFSSKIFIFMLIIMTCGGAAEMTMAQWSSLFAEKGLNVNKVVGDILGPCLFGVLMGVGRTIFGIFGEKINLRLALMFSAALSAVCYFAAAFIHIPILSLLFCAVSGFAVSIMWPGILSFSGKSFPRGGTAMFGMLAVAGDLGCAAGPWVAGLVSDITNNRINLSDSAMFGVDGGLSFGLLTAAIFPLVMLVGVSFLKEMKKQA